MELITKNSLALLLPKRRADAHKGNFGRLLLVCGSVGYTGAPYLAACGAVRSGAGLVFLGVPGEIYEIEAVKCVSSMPFPLPSAEGKLSVQAVGAVGERLCRVDACLLGPGLGQSEGVAETVKYALKSSRVPLVIDADGINALSGNIDILDEAACPVVLTPHEGEFARLCGAPRTLGREEAASAFAARHGCTVILKGHATVIAGKDGAVFVNTTGGPGMAKGGSGDVLSGMLTALIGQGQRPEEAARLAVWLHGRAGDLAAAKLGEYSMTPSDLVEYLPAAFMELAEQAGS